MFAILLDKRNDPHLQAQLLAPNVADHLYAAAVADLTPNADVTWSKQRRIERGTSSTVKIPGRPDTSGKIPSGLQVVINWKNSKVDHVSTSTPPYWSISVPMPDNIWTMRKTSSNIFDPNGKTYKDNGMMVSQVPTVYVLTYSPIDSTNPPTLDGDPITVSPIDNVARLHLFAASPFLPTAASLNMAISEMNQMFRDANDKKALDLSFQSQASPVQVDSNTGYPSVLSCEEMHLGELEVDCDTLLNCPPPTKPAAGTQPTNCMSLVVTVP
jgi:hypothetical protein